MKYKNIKTTIDGIQFDSKKEAQRYAELKLEEKAGLIHNLELQPKFELLKGFIHVLTEEKVRGITYIADFRYWQGDIEVVEDVKGIKTEAYKIKRKLFLSQYPFIYFQEV